MDDSDPPPVREIGFSDWGGQKNFSEARLFSPKNPRNFSQAKVFSPKIPRIFSKARFFPLKFSNFWGIWAPKQLSKAGVEQARTPLAPLYRPPWDQL